MRRLAVVVMAAALMLPGCGGDTGEAVGGVAALLLLTVFANAFISVTTSFVELAGDVLSSAWVTSVQWLNQTTGQWGFAVGTNSWSVTIPLTPGANVIVVTAYDADGHVDSRSVTATWQ